MMLSLTENVLNLKWIRKKVFGIALIVISVGFALKYLLTYYMAILHQSPGVTRLWYQEPILSVYIQAHNQGNYCAHGYEAVKMNNNISSISSGPCGCAQNTFEFQSTNATCSQNKASACTTITSLHALESASWRRSTICVKRGGEAAATVRNAWWFHSHYQHWYISRPQPNEFGFCPVGYNNCGKSVCFPSYLECPITNLMILPDHTAVPANQAWEAVGTFAENNHILYVRRNYKKELPIVNLVVKLAAHNRMGDNKRGICFDGADQIINTPLVANPAKLWAYEGTLPDTCTVTDARYTLIDTMTLQDHFLQNLQLTEPTCAGFSLYSLSDPRYLPALDPDYLNSGVKCSFDSKYTCARDPYQRTDCSAGDNICDGVMNQNICGAYVHAVRSAFSTVTHTTLGMYFAREIEWNEDCYVKQNSLLDLPRIFHNFMFLCHGVSTILWLCFLLPHGEIRYMFDYYRCLLVLLVVGYEMYYINQVTYTVYNIKFFYCSLLCSDLCFFLFCFPA